MIEAIRNGSRFAFEQAYIQHREKVYAYLLKKTNNDEDAKDLLQLVYLKLWQYRSSLSADYLLEQHIFNIARTVFIDHLRVCNKQALLKRHLEEGKSISYPSSFFDLQKNLRIALSSMPEIRKKVFILHKLEGYTYKDVSDILSISAKAVDNNVSKALKQLRKYFALAVALIGIFH